MRLSTTLLTEVNKAENKVSQYEDGEDDKIKLAECGQVEVEVREEKVGVRYVKDGEES